MSHPSLFTSESVCAGHPDKVCDQISDAILDAVLTQDPESRVAIETLVTTNRVVIAGEVSTAGKVNYAEVARQQIKRLGYTYPELDFTADTATIEVHVHEQSPEIAVGVKKKHGAGDQGMMFGYACTDTPQLMPLPISLAHSLAMQIDHMRELGTLPYLLPDGKCQVTVRYEDGTPKEIEQLVLALPHSKQVGLDQVAVDAISHIAQPILREYGYSISPKKITVNGTGIWHFSGPGADTGLTGRKIIVDGYGGYARVGGGAFSGKDPSKVDRSGAYGARFVAKNIIAAGLADQAEVSLAYCIGVPEPVMKNVETFGTAHASDEKIAAFVDGLLDCSVDGIIDTLDLRRPIYLPTAAYGHFGRSEFPWEAISA